MAEKIKTIETVAKVAIIGAAVFKIGSDIYNNWNRTAASAVEETKNEKGSDNNAEESKEQPQVVYQLEPDQDIDSLLCPITMETIVEPATTPYGHLFELSAIKDWVRRTGTCPLTKKPLTEAQIYPQYGLKDTIAEMRSMKRQNEESQRRIQELEAMLASKNDTNGKSENQAAANSSAN